jgi:enoyl-CoA hydratase/carnithine racemase
VAANGPLGTQPAKALMRAAVTEGPAAGRATQDQMAAVFESADAREGAAAFMEKRPPNFIGH